MCAKKSFAEVAIITRTKNRNLLLERALKSVLAQTDKNYIHVVLNDGGDEKALKKLLDKYPDTRRILISNKKSVGWTPALNQAIRAVGSTFIMILDDDDSFAPQRIEVATKYMKQSKAIAAVHVTDRVIEKISNNTIVHMSTNRWLEGVNSISLYKQCLDNYMTNGCITYRRSLFDELGGYDESLPVAEDWDFGLRTLLKYDVDFIETNEPLSFYHHRPEQTGIDGNSVFADQSLHKHSLMLLRNKYLRDDIAKGKIGVGYIMNNLAYLRERDELAQRNDQAQIVRLESHMNYVGDELKCEIHQASYKQSIKNILHRVVHRTARK